MPDTVIFLTSGTSWTVPADFGTPNSVHCIGASGAVYDDRSDDLGEYRGAGAGAYSGISNLVLTAGASISFAVGAGGLKAGGTDGGDTWFNGSSFAVASVAAKGGGGCRPGQDPGPGGQASEGIGTVKHSGGSGFRGGGGGAGGPDGDGQDANHATGDGGRANNSIAKTWTQTSDGATASPGDGHASSAFSAAGNAYGGAPSAAQADGRDGVNGSQGLIVVIYTPAIPDTNTSAGLGAITLSAPATTGAGSGSASASLSPIAAASLAASALGDAFASAALGTVTIAAPTAVPHVHVVVSCDVATAGVSPPGVTAIGGAAATSPLPAVALYAIQMATTGSAMAPAPLPSVALAMVGAAAFGAAQVNVALPVATLSVTAPIGAGNAQASAALPPTTLSALALAAVGGSMRSVAIPPIGLFAPTVASSGDAMASASPRTVTAAPLAAHASASASAVILAFPHVSTVQPMALAKGGAGGTAAGNVVHLFAPGVVANRTLPPPPGRTATTARASRESTSDRSTRTVITDHRAAVTSVDAAPIIRSVTTSARTRAA